MIGKAFNARLWVTVPVFAVCGSELQVLYRGRRIWVRKADWQMVG